MDLEQELRDRRETETRAARDKYRSLLVKAAMGKPTSKDIGELNDLLPLLAVTEAEAALVVTKLKRYFANAEVIELQHEINGEAEVAERERQAYDAETARLAEQLKTDR